MVLTIAPKDIPLKITQTRGRDAQKKQMGNLGFVVGAEISIVTELRGDLIVNIKNTRVAISRQLANRIQIEII